MKKMNKKGFTLIEMLVVIAIIAVLVSIIIPTVSSATTKAKAATDAANLRAVVAEASIDYLDNNCAGLSNDYTLDSKLYDVDNQAVLFVDDNGALVAYITIAEGTNAGSYDINHFSVVAESGDTADSNATFTVPTGTGVKTVAKVTD